MVDPGDRNVNIVMVASANQGVPLVVKVVNPQVRDDRYDYPDPSAIRTITWLISDPTRFVRANINLLGDLDRFNVHYLVVKLSVVRLFCIRYIDILLTINRVPSNLTVNVSTLIVSVHLTTGFRQITHRHQLITSFSAILVSSHITHHGKINYRKLN